MLALGEERTGMRVAGWMCLGSRPSWVIAAAAAAFVLASCATAAPAGRPGAGAGPRSGSVISLNQISTLRSLFNRDDGHTRLMLIFSPT